MKHGLKIVFIGVCGSGKTTLAAWTAKYLGCEPVLEADLFHSPEMKLKMNSGVPLSDEDRWPWLDRIREAMIETREATAVVTCSGLRRIYREKLLLGPLRGRVHFIFLDAPEAIIAQRLAHRTHEFMPASLLGSQFEILEKPDADEPVTTVSVAGTQEEAIEAIKRVLAALEIPLS
jgi:carbohydrate kinase (thermoresistant glucokinase family)